MKGADRLTVKKLMGHAGIQPTMIYAHLAPDHLAEATNRLSLGQVPTQDDQAFVADHE